MKRSILLERVYPHPIERVWRAISDRRAIATWLMDNDFEPEVGRTFTFTTKPRRGFDGVVRCEVKEVDAPRRLAYSWRGGPGGGKPNTLDTLVTFTLERMGANETKLVLEHSGFDGFGAVLISFMLEPGWKKMMKGRLVATLDTLARGENPGGAASYAGCETAASKAIGAVIEKMPRSSQQ